MQIIFANTKNISCALVLLVTLSEPANGSTASFKLDAPRAAGAQSPAATRTTPIFIFHADEFWLNLHHFLYVLGRSANKTRDSSREAVVHAPADQDQGLAGLKPKQKQIWREAVAAYAAGPSQKDLIFDDPLAEITSALARAGDEKSLVNTGVDARIAQVLTQAAPIYRKVWWTKHRAANRAWKAAMQELVKQHGPKVLDFITNAYRLEWPVAGYDVHVSAYSNWAGAYSTKGNLLVASSLDAGVQGAYGLETIFHEGTHQWDTQVLQALREQARKLNVPVPANLSHGLIFFTAGEAVRHIFPDHVPYAYKFGVWERGLSNVREALEQSWKPYLEGHGTRDEAFAELIKRLGRAKPESKNQGTRRE